MPENTTTTKNKPQKRTNYLTEGRIKKEKAKLSEMFAGIEDEDRRTLVNSVKVALLQAKTELKKEGLTTETKNASQKFIKAHPSTAIYEKYARQYTQIINQLIEYLPPKEKKKVSKLAALRDE